MNAPLRVVLPPEAPAAQRLELLRTLLDRGYAVDSAPGGGALMDRAAADGAPAAALVLTAEEIAGLEAAAVLARVEAWREQAQGPRPSAWKPWFPVIDYQRCTNCMQCLSFCLFDVYGTSAAGKIVVRNQDHCKTDCPACSRVCPEVAILFPKYRHGPINGDDVRADDVRREAMKVDISALLGGDIYSMLRDRSEKARSRFSKERDEERALKERQTCLVKLREQMDLEIPPEVLASLPSPDQIRAKAEAAQERAREALARAEAAAKAEEPS
jgi:NAD-dependent dihydropyrimidine dehydrogenase PreA subunit